MKSLTFTVIAHIKAPNTRFDPFNQQQSSSGSASSSARAPDGGGSFPFVPLGPGTGWAGEGGAGPLRTRSPLAEDSVARGLALPGAATESLIERPKAGAWLCQAEFPFASSELGGSMARTVLIEPPARPRAGVRLHLALLQLMQAAQFGALKQLRPDQAMSKRALLQSLGLAGPEQLGLFERFPTVARIAGSGGQPEMLKAIQGCMAIRYPPPCAANPQFSSVGGPAGGRGSAPTAGWWPSGTSPSAQAAGGVGGGKLGRMIQNAIKQFTACARDGPPSWRL